MKTRIISGAVLAVVGSFCIVMGGPVLLVLLLFASLVGMDEFYRAAGVYEKNGGKPIKIVANLPYYITTPIIMSLFESHVPMESLTLMVQKEVAARMAAGPGSKDYGSLSLAVQYYSEPYLAANVPQNCFIPRPNVDSAVVRLTCRQEPPVAVKDEALMFAIIRASFEQRRKTLVNSLTNSARLSFDKETVRTAIAAAGLPETIRGEALTLPQFAVLADALT